MNTASGKTLVTDGYEPRTLLKGVLKRDTEWAKAAEKEKLESESF